MPRRKKKKTRIDIAHARSVRDNPPSRPEDYTEFDVPGPEEANLPPQEQQKRAMMRMANVLGIETLPFKGERGFQVLKANYLRALVRCMGLVTTACANTGVSKMTLTRWRETDEVFSKAELSISDVCLDFVEGKLFNLIQNGDRQAIMFYLRTRGRHRGWVEQQRIPWIDPDRDGDDVFGASRAVINSGEYIALEELHREVPPESLDAAFKILEAEEASA